MEQFIGPQTPAPPDYPFEVSPDEYSLEPFAADFGARRKAFFEFVLRNPAPSNPKAPWFELARLAAGGAPHEGIFDAALEYIVSRQDGADYALHAILRMLYQYRHHLRLSEELLDRAAETVQGFKFWPDEPGDDSMCTWTEHHYFLFASAGFLAGQLFPEEQFTNSGLTGEQLAAAHRPRVLSWLNLRFFTGFSEWLSNVAYDPDLAALLNLADFCRDKEIRQRACMLIDLLLFEMAVNNYAGVFGSTHGRSDELAEKWSAQECTTDTMKLLFGKGCFSGSDNMSAVAFALSPGYRLPGVLYAIANDVTRPELVHRQRAGICIDQADWWDLQPKDVENGMHLMTLEAYLHPRTANLFVKMLNRFRWWDHPQFKLYHEKRGLLKTLRLIGLLPLVARRYQRDVCRATREEVNIYTYRTPDYMLSSAVDYRKGFGGDQQHIWQATLGPDAVCFTTHPARLQGSPPNYWTGAGCLPRVAQLKNVLFAIYRVENYPSLHLQERLPLTHAWLPRDKFEEIVEQDGWIFARSGDGYLALLSEHPYEWRELPGEDSHREVLVHSKRNIWICELGRRAVDGSFEAFIQHILDAEVLFSGSRVTYNSPSAGRLEFAWEGPLLRDGREVPQEDFPRYASPYAQVEFPPEKIRIELGSQNLDLDWLIPVRTVSDFAE